MQPRLLPHRKLIDLGRSRPQMDDEFAAFGHDLHQHVTGSAHAADRMDRELIDPARQRGPDLKPLEMVLRRDLLLFQFGDPARLTESVGKRNSRPV
jgi:hypothetical protein